MNLINCNAVNCSHNKDMVCHSNRINIVGKNSNKDDDTSCGSFLDSKTYGTLTNNIFEEGNPCDCLVCNVENITTISYAPLIQSMFQVMELTYIVKQVVKAFVENNTNKK